MKCALISLPVIFAVVTAGGILAISQFNLSAQSEPGYVETYLLTKAKHELVHASSRKAIPQAISDLNSNMEEGEKLFGTECASCHVLDGHKPTDAGRWMYPRAADLTSGEVQQYSDSELFWIVKNGVRLSGMPAFGNVEPNEHIWDLVLYLRKLRS